MSRAQLPTRLPSVPGGGFPDKGRFFVWSYASVPRPPSLRRKPQSRLTGGPRMVLDSGFRRNACTGETR